MPQNTKKPMILIIDDTPANIEVLMEILSGKNYRISAALNGKEGIEMALKLQPNLILLDVMMPVMDGFSTCKNLKENSLTGNIPVMFLTAKIQPEDITRGFEAGAVDYVVKPFNEAELIARIENHLELQQKKDELKKERNELRKKNHIVEQDLKLARTIQENAMPSKAPRQGVAFHYCSMAQVGGDFYTFFELPEDKMGVFVSDVSGHGVAAAFITLLIKNTLYHNERHLGNPEKLMAALNSGLQNQTAGNFFTAIYAIIDYKNLEIEYVTAGHNQPYIISDQIEELEFEHKSLPMGLYGNDYLAQVNKDFRAQKKSLKKGSRLLFYTDGLTEAVRPKDQENYGPEDFESAVLIPTLGDLKDASAENIIHTIMEKLKNFCGTDTFEDDVCVICTEI